MYIGFCYNDTCIWYILDKHVDMCFTSISIACFKVVGNKNDVLQQYLVQKRLKVLKMTFTY